MPACAQLSTAQLDDAQPTDVFATDSSHLSGHAIPLLASYSLSFSRGQLEPMGVLIGLPAASSCRAVSHCLFAVNMAENHSLFGCCKYFECEVSKGSLAVYSVRTRRHNLMKNAGRSAQCRDPDSPSHKVGDRLQIESLLLPALIPWRNFSV